MRIATTIIQKGGKSTLVHGVEVPADEQRRAFQEATPKKGETLILFVTGNSLPRVKVGGSQKFQKVPPRGPAEPKAPETVGSEA